MAALLSDLETRELIHRVHEVNFAFGDYKPTCTFSNQVDDYMASLLETEKHRKQYRGTCPQLHLRLPLVDFMISVVTVEKLTRATLFAAVYLFDRFSDVHLINEKQLHLVAITCLIIAGKLEENDTVTPKFRKLWKFIPEYSARSPKIFVAIEKYILEFYDFQILLPTEVNFLELYMLFALDGVEMAMQQQMESDTNNNMLMGRYSTLPSTSVAILQSMQSNVNKTRISVETIRKCCYSVLHHLLKVKPTEEFPPSLVAAAILMHARRESGMNFWTPRLQAVSSYNIRQVNTCLKQRIEVILQIDRMNCKLPEPTFIVTNRPYEME